MNAQKQAKPPSPQKTEATQKTMTKQIGLKVARKLNARRHPNQKIWFGLGMMGLIGWSVALPTLLGAGLGIYFDAHYPSDKSWTLAFLVAGLALGCFNAWHWIAMEDRAIHVPANDMDEQEAKQKVAIDKEDIDKKDQQKEDDKNE
jgi:ATP synthase protein I